MTASRISFLVFAFYALLAAQSHAQSDVRSGSPMRLAPPINLAPSSAKGLDTAPKTGATPASALPTAAKSFKKPPTNLSGPRKTASAKKTNRMIEVDSLQSIKPDAAGSLSVEQGGLGAAMWTGTSRATVDRLLPLLPVSAASPAMRDLMRRLLLTGARPPQGPGESGSLVALRAKLLSDMGDHVGVTDLLNATPGRFQNEQLVRIEADARFLANDNARACALTTERVNTDSDGFWQKAFIFCQILSGEQQKAALGLALLRELGEADAAFFNLADALINGETATIESLPDPSPLHLTMARTARAAMPADVISTNRPGVLSAIAVSPSSSVELRLDAAERAETSGALPVDVLRQLYSSVSFSQEDMANPLTKAEAENGPVSRALLYRASLVQTVPTAQAEVLSRAFSLSRKEGRYASTARVFLPILKRIPASRELVWFATEAVRALLIGNERQSITPWLSLLRETAMFNKDSEAALVSIMPVARLAGLNESQSWSVNELETWWQAERKKEGAQARAEMLYSLFEALGETIPTRLWDALVGSPGRVIMAMPSPAIWSRLVKATEVIIDEEPLVKATKVMLGGKELGTAVEETQLATIEEELGDSMEISQVTFGEERLGETVLFALLALGTGGPTQANPVVLKQVISALRAARLETAARALAVEAALAMTQ